MRQLFGKGTPRGLQDFSSELLLSYLGLWREILSRIAEKDAFERILMLPAQLTVSFSPQHDRNAFEVVRAPVL